MNTSIVIPGSRADATPPERVSADTPVRARAINGREEQLKLLPHELKRFPDREDTVRAWRPVALKSCSEFELPISSLSDLCDYSGMVDSLLRDLWILEDHWLKKRTVTLRAKPPDLNRFRQEEDSAVRIRPLLRSRFPIQ